MKKNKDRILFIIIFIAILLRFFYVFQMSKNDPLFYHPFSDALRYHQLAQSVLSNGMVGTEPFYHAPLYQYFVALIYTIFGVNLLIVRIVQVLLGTINVLLIYSLAHRYFNKTVAKIAGFIAAIYPMFIFYDAEILMPTFFIFLVLLGFYFIEKGGHRNIFLAGIIFGLAAITRQNILVVIIFFPLYLLIKYKKIIKKNLLLFWLGALFMILPVTIRNALVLKEPILISWQGGINFYFGNHPDADGVTGSPPGSTRKDFYHAYLDLKKSIENEVGHSLFSSEFDKICFYRGIQFIIKRPVETLGLYIKKFYLFFAGYEISSERDIYRTTKYGFLKFILFKFPFFQFPFGLLLPLALVGIYCSRARWREFSYPLLFSCLYSASFIIFFVCARYRMAIIPVLIIFASFGIFSLLNAKREKKFIVPLIIFIGSYIIFNANFYQITDPNIYLTKYQVSQVHFSKKRYEQALQKIESSIRNNPDFAESHNLKGLIMKALGCTDKAENEFLKAIDIDVRFSDAYINLGNLYISRGELDKAEFYYAKAVHIDSSSTIGFNNLGNVYFQKGMFEDALRYYNYAIDRDPEYTSPLYHAGLIYYKLGETVEAESLWQLVLKIDNAHEGAQKALKFFLGKNGLQR